MSVLLLLAVVVAVAIFDASWWLVLLLLLLQYCTLLTTFSSQNYVCYSWEHFVTNHHVGMTPRRVFFRAPTA